MNSVVSYAFGARTGRYAVSRGLLGVLVDPRLYSLLHKPTELVWRLIHDLHIYLSTGLILGTANLK